MAEFPTPLQRGAPLAGQRPVKSYRRAKFWDWIAERYARTPVADEASYKKKLQITQDYLRPGMEVLEFGCGTGSTALIHAPHVKHIHAIDISSRDDRNRARQGGRQPGRKYYVRSIEL